MNKTLIIDKEFKGLIPPLTPEEFNQLEQNCLNDGILESIKVWHDVIIDGHNRYEIASKNGLDFAVTELNFENRADAIEWIILHQLGRRNLTEEQKAYLRGRRYENEKQKQGGTGSNQHKTEQSGNFCHSAKTETKLAEEYNVSAKTIRNDADFAKGVDLIEKAKPEEKQQILTGKSELTKQEIQGVGKIQKQVEKEVKAEAILKSDAEIEAEIEQRAKERVAEELKKIALAKKNVHVSNNSGENEWYTPANLIECVRLAMGSIDTDPASCELANKTVNSRVFYDEKQNGLIQKWNGNVWINPPYSQPQISDFISIAISKYEQQEIMQCCILVNNATETKWFQEILKSCNAVCFLSQRVKFIDKNGNPTGAPLQGQAILYMGNNIECFKKAFKKTGVVLKHA